MPRSAGWRMGIAVFCFSVYNGAWKISAETVACKIGKTPIHPIAEGDREREKDMEKIKNVVRPKIGLYTSGLKAYWTQFEGLRERLIEYGKFIEKRLAAFADVKNYGLVDDEE